MAKIGSNPQTVLLGTLNASEEPVELVDVQGPGQRNIGSETNSYLVTHEEVNYTIVDLGDNSTTVSSAPALFYGVYVNSTVGEDLVIKDDTTAVFTIAAASMTANTYLSFGDKGIRFETSLVIDPDDTSTEADFVVLWRAI